MRSSSARGLTVVAAAVAAAAAAAVSTTALAWGRTGHLTVCEIAFRNLTPATKKAVNTVTKGKRFAPQCTWPDEVRKKPQWKHTRSWHFVNVEDGKRYYDKRFIDREGDVLQAILAGIPVLTSPSDSDKDNDKLEQLRFVGHFVGDIHQPLHVGRKSDKGGNGIKVRWFGSGGSKKKTLHQVWDTLILERFLDENKVKGKRASQSRYTGYADLLLQAAKPQDFDSWILAPPSKWLAESLEYRSGAYQVGDGQLDNSYYQRHIDLANRRVLQAGIRLAAVLNRAFDPGGADPRTVAFHRWKMRETSAHIRSLLKKPQNR